METGGALGTSKAATICCSLKHMVCWEGPLGAASGPPVSFLFVFHIIRSHSRSLKSAVCLGIVI